MAEIDKKFKDAKSVLKIVSDIELAGVKRGRDRALMNSQFNGDRPFSTQQEKELQIQINTNFLEGFNIAKDAILQTNSALLYKDRLVEFTCLEGPTEYRTEWAEVRTNAFNAMLKEGDDGKKFMNRMKNRNTSLTMHGIGPMWWSVPGPNDWLPFFVALEDLLIPTDTPLELADELGYMGVNSWLTPYRLYEMAKPSNADSKNWNRELVTKIMSSLQKIDNWTPDYWNFYLEPEKAESLWKQHAIYLNSDAVPKVKITNFYYQEPESGKWKRKVILRDNASIGVTESDQFLYVSEKPFADSLSEILHCQFGDTSVVAPAKFHSIRGLAVPLFSPVELQNRLRCQFAEHVFQNLVPLISLDNPIDQGRPMMLRYQQYGVLQKGVRFVGQDERHQIDPRLIEAQMSEFRQTMQENSASYVQDIDSGGQKPMTLGEAQIRLQTANRMVASMIQGNFEQEPYMYNEIHRRSVITTTSSKSAKEFQRRCKAGGIPDEINNNTKAWRMTITKPYGSGDQTLAQQEVVGLMGVYPRLDPSAQRKVLRDFISVLSRNPARAIDLVPYEPQQVTAGSKAADQLFGTLMMGVPVGLVEGIEQQDYILTMMQKLSQKIQQVESIDNTGDTDTVIGMSTVLSDIERHIEIMAEEPSNKEFVTTAQKALGVMTNKVKGFGQRVAEKNQGPDAEKAQQEMQIEAAKAEQQMKASQAKALQDMEQKEAAFVQKTEQQKAQFEQQLAQQKLQFEQQLRETVLQAKAELEADIAKNKIAIEAQKQKAEADAIAAKAKAKASKTTDKTKE